MELFIGSIALALVVSFFCSLSEATVLSLTPGEVAHISKKHPRLGKIWQGFKEKIDRPIVVILVLNTVAHTIGATIAGAQFEKIWQGKGILWFSVSFTFGILFFTEIIPKTMGVEYRKRLALILALPLHYLVILLRPIIMVARVFSRPFSRKSPTKSLALEELRALAAHARLSREIGSFQEKIIQEASHLSQKLASDIMLPAKEIISFSTEQSIEELAQKATFNPHTRFPLCARGDINQVIGYVNFKELLILTQQQVEDTNVMSIIRPVRFIPPNLKLNKLLRIFVKEYLHIAIVQGAGSKTLGLITLEDIIEELLGEIEDEFDRIPKMVHSISHKVWMVGGGITWEELTRHTHQAIPQFSGRLSDWLLQQNPELLKIGSRYRAGNFEFMIRRVRRSKIFEITLKVS